MFNGGGSINHSLSGLITAPIYPMHDSTSMFYSIVTVVFQIIFRVEMYINDVFSFFKNYFRHQHIKTIQKIQTVLNFKRKKTFEFFGNAVSTAFPNATYISSITGFSPPPFTASSAAATATTLLNKLENQKFSLEKKEKGNRKAGLLSRLDEE